MPSPHHVYPSSASAGSPTVDILIVTASSQQVYKNPFSTTDLSKLSCTLLYSAREFHFISLLQPPLFILQAYENIDFFFSYRVQSLKRRLFARDYTPPNFIWACSLSNRGGCFILHNPRRRNKDFLCSDVHRKYPNQSHVSLNHQSKRRMKNSVAASEHSL